MTSLGNNQWLVEQRDIGTVYLLKDQEEGKFTRDDVGRLYITDPKGDFIIEFSEKKGLKRNDR